jgi:two-component sensor histidine kinase
LMNEVDHRCKNILSVVQAIARQTALGGFEEFMPRFFERIMALAASHDLLVESRWGGAELSDLIRAHLLHFDGAFRSRVTLRGKPFRLSNAAAQTVGMIMHELATNAVKYGALSDETGQVEIAWDFEEKGNFSIAWTEYGGPSIAAPTRRGFGSTVITAMAEASFAGKVDLAFEREGLRWRLICPATKMLEQSVLA